MSNAFQVGDAVSCQAELAGGELIKVVGTVVAKHIRPRWYWVADPDGNETEFEAKEMERT